MAKNREKIVSEIMSLVNELAGLPAASVRAEVQKARANSAKIKKGVAGAHATLLDEGYFDEPRELQAVMSRLKQMGYYHSRNAVAMNLLNLTKNRTLNRFESATTGNWEYVIRK